VIGRKDGAAEGTGNDNQHQKFGVILYTLEYDQTVIDNGHVVASKIITVGRVDLSKRKGGWGV
jgi:hypothetical protein